MVGWLVGVVYVESMDDLWSCSFVWWRIVGLIGIVILGR